MKKEILIFIGLFLFLAIGMHHKEWFSHPVEHLTALPHAVAYGFGPEHPFVFTLILYLIIGIPRLFIKMFSKKGKEA